TSRTGILSGRWISSSAGWRRCGGTPRATWAWTPGSSLRRSRTRGRRSRQSAPALARRARSPSPRSRSRKARVESRGEPRVLAELLEQLLRVREPEGLPHERALPERGLQVLVRRDVRSLVEHADPDPVPLLVE